LVKFHWYSHAGLIRENDATNSLRY
jgi:hypothetical protein